MAEHDDESEEDLRTCDSALESVYAHAEATRHGTKFFSLTSRLEIVCYRCGEVLFEGPAYDDAVEGYTTWKAPRRKARAMGIEKSWRERRRGRRK